MLGMGVGCFAIIISISVMNGFENIVHQKLKGFEGDIRVFQNIYDPKWEKIDGVKKSFLLWSGKLFYRQMM